MLLYDELLDLMKKHIPDKIIMEIKQGKDSFNKLKELSKKYYFCNLEVLLFALNCKLVPEKH